MKTKLIILFWLLLLLGGCSSYKIENPTNNTWEMSTFIFRQSIGWRVDRFENTEAICYILSAWYAWWISCKRK